MERKFYFKLQGEEEVMHGTKEEIAEMYMKAQGYEMVISHPDEEDPEYCLYEMWSDGEIMWDDESIEDLHDTLLDDDEIILVEDGAPGYEALALDFEDLLKKISAFELYNEGLELNDEAGIREYYYGENS